jgi:tight adherence protein B
MLPLLVIVGVIIVLIQVAFLVVRGLIERRRLYWRKRLNAPAEEADVGLIGPDSKPAADWQGRVDQAFEQVVRQTGLGWTPGQALGVMTLAGVVLAGFLLLWRGEVWLMTLGLVVGLVAPLPVLLALRARRRRALQEQLPDVLLLLARSLRAGLSLEQALTTVAELGTRPLADEFRRGVEQIKLGLTVPAALQGMARRLRLADFNVFVTAVTLSRSLGGNLALLLDRVASSTRDRNLFRGYFRTATALGRITGIFLSAAAPVLFLGYALWQPDFVERFVRSTAGLQALGVAIGLEILGIVWMTLLLRVDY